VDKYNVHFCIFNNMRLTPDGWPIANNYDFWQPLVLHFLPYSDSLRIDCWIDDEYAINKILPHAKKIDRDSTPYMINFWIDITDQVIEDIILHPFDAEHKIAWFSLSFEKENNPIFSSAHYGTEFWASAVDKETLAFIQSSITEDFYIHTWDVTNTD